MSIQKCKYCRSENTCKNGFYEGKQTYLCKSCKRRFTPADSYHKFFKENLPDLIKLVLQEETVREIAQVLNINIKTAHKWRLKVLEKLQQPKIPLGKVTIIDETYVRDNQKGIRSIQGRKSRKRGVKARSMFNFGSRALGTKGPHTPIIFIVSDGKWYGKALEKTGGLKKVDLENHLEIVKDPISPRKKITLFSDKHSAIKGYAKDNKKHIKLKAAIGLFKEINLVNNIHMHFKNFIKNFRGIATKNMDKYTQLFLFRYEYKRASFKERKNIIRKLAELFC